MLETNYLENTDIKLFTHSVSDCQGPACPIHNRTDHCLRPYPQVWTIFDNFSSLTSPYRRRRPLHFTGPLSLGTQEELIGRICPCGWTLLDPDSPDYLTTMLDLAKSPVCEHERQAITEALPKGMFYYG